MSQSFQFVHYQNSDQTIIEPLSRLKVTPQSTAITDASTLWISSTDGTLRRGNVNIETLNAPGPGTTWTSGTIAMTPSGACTTGTFNFNYSTNGFNAEVAIVQASQVNQVLTAQKLTFTNALPVALRPRFAIKSPIYVYNSATALLGTETMGYIRISTTGIVEIGVGPDAPFAGLGGPIFIHPTVVGYLV